MELQWCWKLAWRILQCDSFSMGKTWFTYWNAAQFDRDVCWQHNKSLSWHTMVQKVQEWSNTIPMRWYCQLANMSVCVWREHEWRNQSWENRCTTVPDLPVVLESSVVTTRFVHAEMWCMSLMSTTAVCLTFAKMGQMCEYGQGLCQKIVICQLNKWAAF